MGYDRVIAVGYDGCHSHARLLPTCIGCEAARRERVKSCGRRDGDAAKSLVGEWLVSMDGAR